METIAIKPSKNSAKINKSVIMARKVRNYTDEEKREMLREIGAKFCHPSIFGKGRVLGDIVSPLYREIDE
jgi:hypothetical protein